MEKFYKIAGLTVKMDTYGRTEEQSKPYECAPCEAVDIELRPDRENYQEHYPHLCDEDREYVATGSCFYGHLLNFNGLLLHASAVVMDGKAYLFSAPCGTGKSTHTQLWLKVFGDRATILNDDKPALRCEDGVWYAYGTPWSGKYDLNCNLRVPLAGIAMLERADTNSVEPFTGAKAVFALLEQTVRPRGVAARDKLLKILDSLFKQVPVWKLRCNMEDNAAQVSYEAMRGKE